MFLTFFVLLSLLSFPSWVAAEVENCSTTVPDGYNDPQPNIVPFPFRENFTIVELPAESGARCLDGTNYKFYWTPAQGSGISKWVFYWQGASFCGADGVELIESCYGRQSTAYGSSDSTYWGSNGTLTVSKIAAGWFSSSEDWNPKFWNWNKVFFISCDGANYQGSLDDPIYYNGTPIYFRGMNNTLSTLDYLKPFGLMNASEIILGGGSSGATSSVIWTAYLQDYFPSSVRLSGVADAGLFIDTFSQNNHCYLYRFFMQSMAKTLNLSSGHSSIVYRRCPYKDTDEFWKCLVIQYMYKSIEVPMFFINSQNDFKQLTNLMSIGCINDGGLQYCDEDDRKQITYVREKFLRVTLRMKRHKPHWGFWLRTCFEHTYHFTWAWYGHSMDVFSAEALNSTNIQQALYSWYDYAGIDRPAISYIDVIDWLHNPLCRYGSEQYDEDHTESISL